MIYVIDSAFALDKKESCIIIKNTELSIIEMTNLIGSLATLYRDITQHHVCEPSMLLDILCTHFECTDKKHKYSGELSFIESRVRPPILHATFVLHDELIIWMDIAEAMHFTRSNKSLKLNDIIPESILNDIAYAWTSDTTV